ncbi:hypothetical protein EMPS_05593 [Entomortierella parvispora]|uniref:Uncharacterized protein n=1 Tax=Entomortierella parvispora TaxID=205924 RepID=A0A9P3HB15_9FUNG|nr:hypothetical protein EMPS_05593 [Entomortierella parvispora]
MVRFRSSAPKLPHPWTGEEYTCGFPVTLLPELCMRAVSNAIREKDQWWTKYKNPVIAARWKQEILESGNLLTEPQIRFIFQELEWYAGLRQQQLDKGISIPIEMAIDGTRRADGLIPPSLKEELMTCVAKLINVPEHQKDWHPNSNKQVLDLVHPSLFPVIAGRTRVAEEMPSMASPFEWIGRGTVLEKLNNEEEQYFDSNVKSYSSRKYQWLPTDVHYFQNGRCAFESYINNLHPIEHKALYPVLEEILEYFMPMFGEVLAEMRVISRKKRRLTADPYDWYEIPEAFKVPYSERDEASYDAEDEWCRIRTPKPVSVPEFVAPPVVEPYDLKAVDLQPLQVIVKLANIELTPENPRYEGGAWHVEGMANEDIVATGIYYYHSENVTETRLNFRIAVEEPDYEQSDVRGCEAMYGLTDGGPLVQNLDGIITKQDRCIAFPNIYQHQVQPFELEDKTRPGTRQILVFFLINPQQSILSTSEVPPQQKDWIMGGGFVDEVEKRLPAELVEQVEEQMDWPMSMAEAKNHRLDLMKERKFFVDTTNAELFERPFSLCEH